MRTVSRSESSSFPSLETLLPMEKSWASEVEREEETSCLHGKNELPNRGTGSVKQIESSWVARKRLNSGSKEVSHRSRGREKDLYGKRASRSFDSKPYRNDKHNDSSRHSEETIRAWRYTSSSRCYPPSVHIRSSEFSVPEERRASQLRNQRGLHETTKFVKPNRTSDSFACRQHSTRSKGGFSTVERRQDHFACLNHRAEMTSEASQKHIEHADDLSHIQGQVDEYKHEFQPSSDKHHQNGHSQYPARSGFSEHRSRPRYVKKVGHQGPCHGVTGWENAKKCGRTLESETKQYNEVILAEQSFEEKPGVINDEGVASETVITTENALPEGLSMFESRCTEESEVKNDDPMAAKKQYEMLASLLFDDLQGIDKDFDETLVGEGPEVAQFLMMSWRPVWTLMLSWKEKRLCQERQ